MVRAQAAVAGSDSIRETLATRSGRRAAYPKAIVPP